MAGKHMLILRLRALRAFSFPVSALPVAIAAAAVRPVGAWQWDVLAACLAGVVALHGAGNLLNDYFDFKRGVDRRLDDDEGRPGRFLVRGELSPRDVLWEAVACLAIGAACGAYVVARCGAGVHAFAAGALVGLYAYTGPPFALKYRALGEALIFVVFGPLLVTGAAFAQTGRVEAAALAVSIPVGLATTAILAGNNLRDLAEDRAAGVRTLAGALGPRAGAALYVGLVLGAVGVAAALGAAGWAGGWLLAAPVTLVFVARPLASVLRDRRVPDIDVRTARFVTVLFLFLLVVLVATGGVATASVAGN